MFDRILILGNIGFIGSNLTNLFKLEGFKVKTLNREEFVDKEKPNGLIDGVNKIFELDNTPIPGSEHIFLNGILQDSGVEFDYILDEKNIIFNEAPLENMRIICSYRS
jgi:nucleoside-diphosphate-sugar epimerase